eukprot:TRINITY_DN131_c0_g1_i7.p1 TRINITY_DN131_c0_g1~~TRINITY_DN131_c0_g1_i7.p1  ORF type:complete len:105 (+),score=9.24 TRINITY_DN131_c0_g1_i7:175-489(+)
MASAPAPAAQSVPTTIADSPATKQLGDAYRSELNRARKMKDEGCYDDNAEHQQDRPSYTVHHSLSTFRLCLGGGVLQVVRGSFGMRRAVPPVLNRMLFGLPCGK